MHDISFTNFSLFRDKCDFEFRPLTLLVGANGSGKSSLIKALEVIQNGSLTTGMQGWQHYAFNKKENILFEWSIAPDLYKKLELIGIQPSDSDRVYYYDCIDETKLDYVDHNGDVVFFMTFDHLKIDIRKVISIMDTYLPKSDLDHLQAIDFKPGLIEIKFPKKGMVNINGIEIMTNFNCANAIDEIFKKDLLVDTFVKYSLSDFTFDLNLLRKTLYDIFAFRKVIPPIKFIRQNEMSFGEKIYDEQTEFGRLLYRYVDLFHVPESARAFANEWKKVLFGKNASIEIKRVLPELNSFSVKLNDRYLTEHGKGTVKLLQLYIQLVVLLAEDFIVSKDNGSVRVEVGIPNAHSSNRSLKTTPFVSRQILVVEEPESNLHPDLQVQVSMMLFEFSVKSECYTLIETHSEYMIRAFQNLVSKNNSFKDFVEIINFDNKEGVGHHKNITIAKDGSLSDGFYSGFMNTVNDLTVELLKYNESVKNN